MIAAENRRNDRSSKGGPYDNMNMLKGDRNRRHATLVF